jgi:nucleotide-binding universal stress UspA family protein
MPFQKVLIAIDGSQFSKIAMDYAFWLTAKLDAELSAQHVLDSRLVTLFVEPAFAEELGFGASIEIKEKVYGALRKIGRVILDTYVREATEKRLKTTTHLDEGHIIDEIYKRADDSDLLILGHRSDNHAPLPSEIVVGSIAERVVVSTSKPVLICVQPLEEIKEITVAFDGSEPSIGALLMAEQLAKYVDLPLRAIVVALNADHISEAHATVEKGEKYLREAWPNEVFSVEEGHPAKVLMDYSAKCHSILALGAYGYRNPEDNVLGSTTTNLLRHTKSSVLIYR